MENVIRVVHMSAEEFKKEQDAKNRTKLVVVGLEIPQWMEDVFSGKIAPNN